MLVMSRGASARREGRPSRHPIAVRYSAKLSCFNACLSETKLKLCLQRANTRRLVDRK